LHDCYVDAYTLWTQSRGIKLDACSRNVFDLRVSQPGIDGISLQAASQDNIIRGIVVGANHETEGYSIRSNGESNSGNHVDVIGKACRFAPNVGDV
jgi:hypothetical protein